MLFLLGLALVVVLAGVTQIPSVKLRLCVKELDKAYANTDGDMEVSDEWFGETKKEIIELLKTSHPEVIPEIKLFFYKFDGILRNWEELKSCHEVALAQEDAMCLFKIGLAEVKSVCADYARGKCSKKYLDAKLCDKIAHLRDILYTFEDVAKLREQLY